MRASGDVFQGMIPQEYVFVSYLTACTSPGPTSRTAARRRFFLCVYVVCLCAYATAASRKSSKTPKSSSKSQSQSSSEQSAGGGEGRGAGEGRDGGRSQKTEEEKQPSYPMVVDDTRFFNNLSHDHTGPPIKLSIGDHYQYSRIFFAPTEGQLSTNLLEELLPDDEVLDLGAEVGVFSLTAARKGVKSVTAIESDIPFATSLEQSVEINGLQGRVLVLTWLPSSSSGYGTVFGKAERGCVYSGPHTTNQTTDAFTRLVYTSPLRSIDEAIEQGLIPRPTVVRVSVEGAEEFALEVLNFHNFLKGFTGTNAQKLTQEALARA